MEQLLAYAPPFELEDDCSTPSIVSPGDLDVPACLKSALRRFNTMIEMGFIKMSADGQMECENIKYLEKLHQEFYQVLDRSGLDPNICPLIADPSTSENAKSRRFGPTAGKLLWLKGLFDLAEESVPAPTPGADALARKDPVIITGI